MRSDKKSEFLKALKQDRVEEEHEDENHAGQEKVEVFIPVVDPAVVVFRRTINYFLFCSKQLLSHGLGSLNEGKELYFDEFQKAVPSTTLPPVLLSSFFFLSAVSVRTY